MKYAALLRGINVGKSVQVPMKVLAALLEERGLTNVVTYLNSGNVVFDSVLGTAELTTVIEEALEKRFGQAIPVLIKTASQMIAVGKAVPAQWGSDETQQTYIAYLFGDIARPGILDELPVKRQYMELRYEHEAVIWHIKKENFNKSQISKLSTYAGYGRMTVRNVTTARRLAELCQGD